MTKGMLLMWGVFAEMERDIISQQVKSGPVNARAKGKTPNAFGDIIRDIKTVSFPFRSWPG